jgi:inner membrane protein
MRYQTHIVSSVAAGLAVTHFTQVEPTIGLFTGVLLGCLLPDIDEPNSYIGAKTSVKIINKNLGISSLVKLIFGHRGFTHSLFATLLVFIPYLLVQTQIIGIVDDSFMQNLLGSILFGVGLGYLFHILGDMLSKSGVPLFMPLTNKRIKVPLYVTGKISEKIVYVISIFFLVFLVYKEFLEKLLA